MNRFTGSLILGLVVRRLEILARGLAASTNIFVLGRVIEILLLFAGNAQGCIFDAKASQPDVEVDLIIWLNLAKLVQEESLAGFANTDSGLSPIIWVWLYRRKEKRCRISP